MGELHVSCLPTTYRTYIPITSRAARKHASTHHAPPQAIRHPLRASYKHSLICTVPGSYQNLPACLPRPLAFLPAAHQPLHSSPCSLILHTTYPDSVALRRSQKENSDCPASQTLPTSRDPSVLPLPSPFDARYMNHRTTHYRPRRFHKHIRLRLLRRDSRYIDPYLSPQRYTKPRFPFAPVSAVSADPATLRPL